MTYIDAIRDLPRVAIGNALDVLATLPEQSIHCCVTSPPYWGLRKYPTEPVIWDGDPKCKHRWEQQTYYVNGGVAAVDTTEAFSTAGPENAARIRAARWRTDDTCSLCGAWRGHLGNEPTPELYISHLVQIFRALRRVLRDDGVAWLNLGDSFAGSGVNDGTVNPGLSRAAQRGDNPSRGQNWRPGTDRADGETYKTGQRNRNGTSCPQGLKPLDLVGIPWRAALALQADGWWLRSDIIWAKKSCMPEPQQGWRWEKCRVKTQGAAHEQQLQTNAKATGRGRTTAGLDIWQPCPGCAKCAKTDGYVLRRGAWRPTDNHEYIFMLAKTPNYYCDHEAVKVPSKREASGNLERKGGEAVGLPAGGLGRSIPWTSDGTSSNLRTVWFGRESYFQLRDDLDAGTKERVVHELLLRGIL